ncbi:MAG: right-handed parallel beta-helix repeat-containing protein [Candidatus Bathyarchaeota archaeon]|nr:right-handed parallel beta-helix repeat-containing protein [Candidatus Bathyarchaeota archaeon]MDW8040332.1 right-handed parallel beta-helix repeat-containing protein [Nitrososphaerota archaeon]
MKKIQVLIFSIILFTLLLILTLQTNAQHLSWELTVSPGESIQRAINNAAPNSTIFIEPGVYFEESYPIIVNKTVTLIGRNADATIIDGQLAERQIFLVKSSGVRILNLTIQNTTTNELAGAAGIDLSDARNVEVSYCKIKNCVNGIRLKNSSQCRIVRNELRNNYLSGIYLRQSSSRNSIVENIISNNRNGIWVADTTCIENRIYHNNFLENQINKGGVGVGGIWHNGYPSGGNYWNDHNGSDKHWGPNQDKLGSDGICDESYGGDLDRYPFMAPLNFFAVGRWNNVEYYVSIASNHTILKVHFDPNEASISYNVQGSPGIGFCRVAVSKQILWVERGHQWIVLVNHTSVNPFVLDQYDEYTYLYFTYNHGTGATSIEIIGTKAIPEFKKEIILMLLILLSGATTLARIRDKPKTFNSVNFLLEAESKL